MTGPLLLKNFVYQAVSEHVSDLMVMKMNNDISIVFIKTRKYLNCFLCIRIYLLQNVISLEARYLARFCVTSHTCGNL